MSFRPRRGSAPASAPAASVAHAASVAFALTQASKARPRGFSVSGASPPTPLRKVAPKAKRKASKKRTVEFACQTSPFGDEEVCSYSSFESSSDDDVLSPLSPQGSVPDQRFPVEKAKKNYSAVAESALQKSQMLLDMLSKDLEEAEPESEDTLKSQGHDVETVDKVEQSEDDLLMLDGRCRSMSVDSSLTDSSQCAEEPHVSEKQLTRKSTGLEYRVQCSALGDAKVQVKDGMVEMPVEVLLKLLGQHTVDRFIEHRAEAIAGRSPKGVKSTRESGMLRSVAETKALVQEDCDSPKSTGSTRFSHSESELLEFRSTGSRASLPEAATPQSSSAPSARFQSATPHSSSPTNSSEAVEALIAARFLRVHAEQEEWLLTKDSPATPKSDARATPKSDARSNRFSLVEH